MKTQIVSFHCVLKNKLGKVLGSTFNRDVIAESQEGSPLQGLVEGLRDLHQGEKRSIFVPAEKAYGFYDPRLWVEVPKKQFTFGRKLKVGDEVDYLDFQNRPRTFRVVKVGRSTVSLDANHALAGEDLIFDIEATAARDATAADIEDDSPETPGVLLH